MSRNALNPAGGRTDGFTLIEILVVLAIMGLIAGTIIMRGALHSTRADLDAAREAASGALRLARDDALLSGMPRTVLLLPDGHTLVASTTHGLSRFGLGRVSGAPTGWHGLLRPDGTALVPILTLDEGGQSVSLSVDSLTGRVARR
jgi:general secretion pathway protein H